HRVEFREARVRDRETRVAPGASDGDRLRIAVDRKQAPFRTEARKNRGAVPAATEGAVDVASDGADRQRLDGLVEQDRLVFRRVWGCVARLVTVGWHRSEVEVRDRLGHAGRDRL